MFKKLILFSLVVFTTSCGPKSGFTTISSEESKNASAGSSGPTSEPPGNSNSAQTWDEVSFDLNGKLASSQYSGSTLISVDVQNESLTLLFPFSGLTTIAGKYAASQAPGIVVQPVLRTNGIPTLAVSIPFKYILKSTQLQPMSQLPNGDPLPAFPAGEIKGMAIRLSEQRDFRVNLYFGTQAVAAFIETPGFDLPSAVDLLSPYPIYNQSSTAVIGVFKIVGSKGNFAGGFYVAARIPRDTSAKLTRLIKF